MTEPAPGATASGPRPWLLVAAALVVVAAAHSPAAGGPAIWDDHQLVLGPGAPRGFDLSHHLLRPYMPHQGGGVAYYRPLTTLSYAADRAWGGGSTVAFHATNLALHLGVVLLLYALARRRGAAAGPAIAAAAAFGLLPRLTESVDWIAGRTDVLAALLVLAALRLHRSGPGGGTRRLAAAAALLLGLLAKEVALAGLLALAAVEWIEARREGRGLRAAAAGLAPAAAATALYLLLRLGALGATAGASPAVAPGPGGRPRLVLQALGEYLRMLLDPLRPRLRIGLVDQVELLPLALGLVALALLAWGAVRAARSREPGGAMALALCIGGLAPVLHAVPLVLTAVAADRFLYLPAAGLALLAAPALDRAARGWPRALAAGALLLVGLLAAGTYARSLDWADEVRLWEKALAGAAPADPVPLHELAMVHVRGDRPEAALPLLERTTPLLPEGMRPEALSDEAAVLSDLGRAGEARERLLRALEARPAGPGLLYNLAVVEMRDLRPAAARAALDRLEAVQRGHLGARAVRARLEAVAREFGDLGPEGPAEPPALRARRARFLDAVGLPRVALPRWAEVAGLDAGPADLVEAAARLLAGGRTAEARAARDRAVAAGAGPSLVEPLDRALQQAARGASAPRRSG
ncbi:MAG: hypothetical protein HZB56_09500 [Deltaproteobacteria bacterium]|nr:hypothetical protein [Deltaproteobacteria bacterium]